MGATCVVSRHLVRGFARVVLRSMYYSDEEPDEEEQKQEEEEEEEEPLARLCSSRNCGTLQKEN